MLEPEKVEGGVAWGSGALGHPAGERMAERVPWSGPRTSPRPESSEQGSVSAFDASDAGCRGKGLCWVDVGSIPQESRRSL